MRTAGEEAKGEKTAVHENGKNPGLSDLHATYFNVYTRQKYYFYLKGRILSFLLAENSRSKQES